MALWATYCYIGHTMQLDWFVAKPDLRRIGIVRARRKGYLSRDGSHFPDKIVEERARWRGNEKAQPEDGLTQRPTRRKRAASVQHLEWHPRQSRNETVIITSISCPCSATGRLYPDSLSHYKGKALKTSIPQRYGSSLSPISSPAGPPMQTKLDKQLKHLKHYSAWTTTSHRPPRTLAPRQTSFVNLSQNGTQVSTKTVLLPRLPLR